MGYADPARQREYQRQWVARRRAEFLADKSCIDCGATEDLEVDHVDRLTKVSHTIWSWSAARRSEELSKCVVRCRACHAAKGVASCDYDQGAILTYENAEEIRERYAAGGVTRQALASEYGVATSSIGNLLYGRTWTTPRLSRPRQAQP